MSIMIAMRRFGRPVFDRQASVTMQTMLTVADADTVCFGCRWMAIAFAPLAINSSLSHRSSSCRIEGRARHQWFPYGPRGQAQSLARFAEMGRTVLSKNRFWQNEAKLCGSFNGSSHIPPRHPTTPIPHTLISYLAASAAFMRSDVIGYPRSRTRASTMASLGRLPFSMTFDGD